MKPIEIANVAFGTKPPDLSEHSNRSRTTVVQRMQPWSRTEGLRIGSNIIQVYIETCWKQAGFYSVTRKSDK
jgi:hypothetical protein